MAYPSLLMIHGAANGAWVWEHWREALQPLGWEVNVLDLRGHGRSLPMDMATVTLEDYLYDVESVAEQITKVRGSHPVMVGWSMGGLLAMMHAAKQPDTPALVLFSPLPPFEVGGSIPLEEVRKVPIGAIGPEYYGVYPDDAEASRRSLPDLTDDEFTSVQENMRGVLESGLARRQGDRGISIPPGAIGCPGLVVYGEEETGRPPELNRKMAIYLGGESLGVEGAGHWGIVYSRRAIAEAAPKVDAWLRRTLG